MSASAIASSRLELLDQPVGLVGVGPAEDRAGVRLDVADRVGALARAAEVAPVLVVDQREDAAADRDPRLAGMARLGPRRAVGADLPRLLDMEGLAGLVELQGRALEVHPELRRPDRGRVGRRPPPDALLQPRRMRLEPQQAGRVREHRPRVRLGEALAIEELQEELGVAPRHVGIGLALGRAVAEVAPAVDDLLGRAPADAELQPAAGDEVGGAGVLGHVEGVLVAHVDDGGADLDAARPRADRREQRKGRGELAGKVVDADIGAVERRAPRPRRRARSTAGARPRAERVPEPCAGDQWPKERNPIFFTRTSTAASGTARDGGNLGPQPPDASSADCAASGDGAREKTRTSTTVKSLVPETSASTIPPPGQVSNART